RAGVVRALLPGQPVAPLLPAGADSVEGPGFPASRGVPGDPGPPLTGTINLTMPLGTWLGLSGSPGEVAGFGPLSGGGCRRLGEGMAASPRTRWGLTVTDSHGRRGYPARRSRLHQAGARPARGAPGERPRAGRGRAAAVAGNRWMYPPAGVQLLPATAVAAAPDPAAPATVCIPRLRPPGRSLRPGPHCGLPPRRAYL